jgi:hypothetical protein
MLAEARKEACSGAAMGGIPAPPRADCCSTPCRRAGAEARRPGWQAVAAHTIDSEPSNFQQDKEVERDGVRTTAMLNTSVLIVDAGAGGTHPGDRPRQAGHCLHPHRAKARPAISAEDGTMQRAHHGDVPAAWAGEEYPSRRAAIPPIDGHFRDPRMNERPLVAQHYQSADRARAEIRTSNDSTQPASGLERGGGQLQCVRLRSMERCY